jgi:hypothetical protein
MRYGNVASALQSPLAKVIRLIDTIARSSGNASRRAVEEVIRLRAAGQSPRSESNDARGVLVER